MTPQTVSPIAVDQFGGKPLDLRLRALLGRDSASGILALSSKLNRISRRHYAGLLGCGLNSLRKHSSVFSEFEQRLSVVTGPEGRLAVMRQWLTDAFNSGELRVLGGRVHRTAFQEQFGLGTRIVIHRYPAIRSLLQEFDEKLQRESYLPASVSKELDLLKAILSEAPKLTKDGLKISLLELAKVTGIKEKRLIHFPFADPIKLRQIEVERDAAASKIDPLLGGRIYRFSPLVAHWPMRFLEKVGVRFKQSASIMPIESRRDPYLQLCHALKWIGASSDENCQTAVSESREHHQVVSGDAWEDALFAYRDWLIAGITSGARTKGRVDQIIMSLRTALGLLSTARIVPPMEIPLPGIKHVRRLSGHRRSVAEVGNHIGIKSDFDYVQFATSLFITAAKSYLNEEPEKGEVEAFVQGLNDELRRNPALPSDPKEAVRLTLERRLDAIRKHASTLLTKAMNAHQQGHQLLVHQKFDAAAFEEKYLNSSQRLSERNNLVSDLFPSPATSTEQQVRTGTANLLALIDQRYGGIPPVTTPQSDNQYGQFFAKRYLSYGGRYAISAMLIPEADAVAAVLTLYLVESGANISVGRTLSRDCMEESDLQDHVRVTGRKARAKGKPIIVDLPSESAAVKGLQWLESASSRLSDAASSEDSDRMFIAHVGGGVHLIAGPWYTRWFERFCAESPGLEGLALQPSMIRSSVLLHASLSNDGRLATGLAIGQHTEAVSQGYQQKWPTRVLYDQKVRQFTNVFEVLVVSAIEGAAQKIGVSVEEFEFRLAELRPTGLGTFCKDHRGRQGEQNDSCSTLDCWRDCPNLLIVAEVEAIATLQLWQSSLHLSQAEWERDRVERWNEVWLPWLCLTDVVEEKMVRGPMIKIWKAAQNRASEMASQPGYRPPQPW